MKDLNASNPHAKDVARERFMLRHNRSPLTREEHARVRAHWRENLRHRAKLRRYFVSAVGFCFAAAVSAIGTAPLPVDEPLRSGVLGLIAVGLAVGILPLVTIAMRQDPFDPTDWPPGRRPYDSYELKALCNAIADCPDARATAHRWLSDPSLVFTETEAMALRRFRFVWNQYQEHEDSLAAVSEPAKPASHD